MTGERGPGGSPQFEDEAGEFVVDVVPGGEVSESDHLEPDFDGSVPDEEYESGELQEEPTDREDGPDEEEGKLPETGVLSTDPVRDYLKSLGKVPLLTAKQEVDMAKDVEAGLFAEHKLDTEVNMQSDVRQDLELMADQGRRVKAHFLEANLRLVVSLAKRYKGRGLPFLDLIQEGNVGLIRAVEKFDYTKGYKFSTYATWWIRQAITRAIGNDARLVRVPIHEHEKIVKAQRIQRQLTAEFGREPDPEEIAAEMSTAQKVVTAKEVTELMRLDEGPVRLDKPIDDDGATELGDRIVDGSEPDLVDIAAFGLLSEKLSSILDELPDREAGIMRMRFGVGDGHPRTLDEVGKAYGVTRERIRQLETKALAKLRHPARLEQLRDFLD